MLTAKRKRDGARPRRRVLDIRTRILDAARALCFRDGPEGISTRKVAERVGCSATAIYLYYRNLDDLLHDLRMEGFTLLVRFLKEADEGGDALAGVAALGRAYWRFGAEHPNYYELMFFHRFRRVPRADVVQREMYALMLLRDVVKGGMERGEIRGDLDAMTVTNALWAEIHGVTSLAVSGRLLQTAAGQDADVLAGILDGMACWLRPVGAVRRGGKHR